jgi:hypothetical protein
MQQISHLIHQALYNKELTTRFTTFGGSSIIEKETKRRTIKNYVQLN